METERPPRKKRGADLWETVLKRSEEFLKTHTTVAASLEAVADNKNGPRTRAFALIASAVNAIPSLRRRMLRSLGRTYDFSQLPIDPDLYELKLPQIGAGYWSEVYLLEPKKAEMPTFVYKIEYPGLKHPVEHLTNVAAHYRRETELLKERYGRYPELAQLIPDTYHLITQSPRTKKPAIAAVQTYAGKIHCDLFDPERKDEIKGLLQSDDSFAKEFALFREVTLALEKEGIAPDFAGENNVLVVRAADTYSIRLIDHQSIDSDNTIAQKRQARALHYLRELDA